MPRLVVHPGSPGQWEIQLRPGENLIGRSITNHFQIPDQSVSSTHCRIVVNEGAAQITDLGSTNGTWVNSNAVRESRLESGWMLKLGDVHLQYLCEEAPAQTGSSMPAIPLTQNLVSEDSQAEAVTPRATIAPSNSGNLRPLYHCKFHPSMAGRYQCPKCNHYFCDTCVATRTAGAHDKFCRRCGVGVHPVELEFEAVVQKSFAERFSGAFLYPLRGMGIIIMVVGMVLLGIMKWGQALFRFGSIRAFVFGCILEMFAGGYLFSYLQGIMHSTAAEDKELPDLPGISNFLEDVILPFFRLLGITLFYFFPVMGAGVWWLVTREPAALWTLAAAALFALLFYPMAFLAVAIHDAVTAANPLLVVPSILKVPGKYLAALVFLALSLGVQICGGIAVNHFFPEGMTTHDMGEFVAMIGSLAFLAFLSFYLLIVGVHLLGLLFVTSKEELGWLKHR